MLRSQKGAQMLPLSIRQLVAQRPQRHADRGPHGSTRMPSAMAIGASTYNDFKRSSTSRPPQKKLAECQ